MLKIDPEYILKAQSNLVMLYIAIGIYIYIYIYRIAIGICRLHVAFHYCEEQSCSVPVEAGMSDMSGGLWSDGCPHL